MLITQNNLDSNFNHLKFSNSWNLGKRIETKMHRIHMYPAKFPSFLVSKAINHVRKKGGKVKFIADIFCGCGTTALESKLNGINFWGCDINPVATLIAKVKSEQYSTNILNKYFKIIKNFYEKNNALKSNPFLKNERIRYWFKVKQINNLFKLIRVIRKLPKGKYRDFFLVGFSNILKPTSKWLTKSIKPTIDPDKKVNNVWETFERQYKMMFNAVTEMNIKKVKAGEIKIYAKNFLTAKTTKAFVDLLITSPPYVTSYEYADLHQLSTLWLGYTKDFKIFRKGTIGSLYHKKLKDKDINLLNYTGKNIYEKMYKKNKWKANSIAKYFLDIKKTISKSYKIINPQGNIAVVIGNTIYKNVKIDNAKFVVKCMCVEKFKNIEVIKRRISSKMLTPYRDNDGKFSNDKRKRKIYAYEYIIFGKK